MGAAASVADEAAPPPAVGGTEAAVRGTGISRYTYQAVASSGIAAQVLGLEATTAHGAFKIPIAVDLQRVPRCNIQGAAMRDHAAVLRDLDMNIWDEVSIRAANSRGLGGPTGPLGRPAPFRTPGTLSGLTKTH